MGSQNWNYWIKATKGFKSIMKSCQVHFFKDLCPWLCHQLFLSMLIRYSVTSPNFK